MTQVHSLFGLMAEELIEVSYLDTKLFNDEAVSWRNQVRNIIQEIRFARASIQEMRDLHKRKKHQIALIKFYKDLECTWSVYKDVQSTAVGLTSTYLEKCREGAWKPSAAQAA